MHQNLPFHTWTQNQQLVDWIQEVSTLCKPDRVHLCDGSKQEYEIICQNLVDAGTFLPLDPDKRKGSFWCHSDPRDVARVEERTFICSRLKEDAGPTNHWKDPIKMKKHLVQLFQGVMKGRTLYVIPFSMGPIGSSLATLGVQITDSPYVVAHMFIMTRMGKNVLRVLGDKGAFIPCIHSVGKPLQPGEKDVSWPCNPDETCVVHFPENREIWSFGSGYGGNALLGKKCLALRIASVKGRDEGWLAEHMLILGITNPEGKKRYFAAAFPSACGKTNLAMIHSHFPGWKVECVGDDIAWMRLSKEGKVYAINPEYGFFGVAPGTSHSSNPHAMKTIEKNTIFTNVALTHDRDVWWEGMGNPPSSLIDWKGKPWTLQSQEKAAHPNARFTALLTQCLMLDPAFDDKEGVPISGIIFGGRRKSVVPLVYESFNWNHGVFIGASLSSEMTAAAAGQIGQLRHDPFAMLPFCGYHMGDYFRHWLEMGQKIPLPFKPKIFHVNWFRASEEGKELWPGFGENMRVLKWIFERCESDQNAIKAPIGYLPQTLDMAGLSLPSKVMDTLLSVDVEAWKKEASSLKEYLTLFGSKLPVEIQQEIHHLEKRLEE